MNKNQRNKLMMIDAVLKVCIKHQDDWQVNVPFSQAVSELQQKRDAIRSASGDQKNTTPGVKQQREIILTSVLNEATRLSKILRAYAVEIEDVHLEHRNLTPRSEWSRVAMEVHRQRLITLQTDLVNNLAGLAAFDIAQAVLDDFNARVAEYFELFNNPRVAIVERKVYTKEIRVLFKDADRILKNRLDLSIMIFENSHPVYFQRFQAAREIVDYHKTKPGIIFPTPDRDDGHSIL